MTNKHIVEINGVKLEVDLRYATQVHQDLKIGSKVKLLEKSEYSDPQVYHGVIIGFENFQSLPTIEVCYIVSSYSDLELKFASINEKSTKKFDMIPAVDWSPSVTKDEAFEFFDKAIGKLENEIDKLKDKKAKCAKYFDVFIDKIEE